MGFWVAASTVERVTTLGLVLVLGVGSVTAGQLAGTDGAREPARMPAAAAAQPKAPFVGTPAITSPAAAPTPDRGLASAYHAALQAPLEQLYGWAQPLHEAVDLLLRGDADSGFFMTDVTAAGTTVGLRAAEDALQAVPALEGLSSFKDDVLIAASGFAGASEVLTAEFAAGSDGDLNADKVDAAVDRLAAAEEALEAAVSALSEQAGRPVPTLPGSAGRAPRVPPTKAQWVLSADRACLAPLRALNQMKEGKTPEEAVARLADLGKLITGTQQRIAALPLPSADVALLRERVLAPMNRAVAEEASIRAELTAALRAAEPFALRRALARSKAFDERDDVAGTGFRSYGAELCALLFL